MDLTTLHADPFDDAAELLYRSFEHNAFRPDMPRCTHCVEDGEVRDLGGDVRDLAPALVARFVTKSGTTWGDATDLRRILPRALHLSALVELPVSRDLVLAKLQAATWTGWPAGEVEAVRRFLLADWRRMLLTTPRAGHAAHRWLRQTATAHHDLAPFLQVWHQELGTEPGPAAVHLAVLLVNSELRPDFPATVADLFDPPRTSDEPGTDDGRDRRKDPVEPHPPVEPFQPNRSNRRAQALRTACGAGTGTGSAPGPATSTSPSNQFGDWLAAPATEAGLSRAARALDHTADARRLDLAVERLRRYRAARSRA